MAVRVRKMNATMRVVDGESLLTPQLMQRIVTQVLDALDTQEEDDRSRRRDTQIGGADAGGQHEGEGR